MRLGKWIRVFNQIVPIPANFSSSFGLLNGSMIHFAMVEPKKIDNCHARQYVEVILSTIPRKMWGSVCSLSVRMTDNPQSLAIATEFLRDNKISIILSEAAGTFGGRAHWDCVCDLTHCEIFQKIMSTPSDSEGQEVQSLPSDNPKTKYIDTRKKMQKVTKALSKEFVKWVARGNAQRKAAFTSGDDQHIEFRQLTGINYANVSCYNDREETATNEKNTDYLHGKMSFKEGGIELPEDLLAKIEEQISLDNWNNILPSHALITCNTEQRYMRLYFVPHVGEFVSGEIIFRIQKIDNDGIGLYNHILKNMPPDLNLLHITLNRLHSANLEDLEPLGLNENNEKRDDNGNTQNNSPLKEIGKIRFVGHWPVDEENITQKKKELASAINRKRILEKAIEKEPKEPFKDSENKDIPSDKLVKLTSLGAPRANDLAVYISYPMDAKNAEEYLNILKRELVKADFLPITGTSIGGYANIGQRAVSSGVAYSAFSPINTCFAFISLCIKNDEYLSKGGKYFTSPWLIAEEAYAFSKAVFFMARLAESGMDLPSYKTDILTFKFRHTGQQSNLNRNSSASENTHENSEEEIIPEFSKSVRDLIKALKIAKQNKDYESEIRRIRHSMYESR